MIIERLSQEYRNIENLLAILERELEVGSSRSRDQWTKAPKVDGRCLNVRGRQKEQLQTMIGAPENVFVNNALFRRLAAATINLSSLEVTP